MVCPWSQFKSAVHSTPFHTQKVTSLGEEATSHTGSGQAAGGTNGLRKMKSQLPPATSPGQNFHALNLLSWLSPKRMRKWCPGFFWLT